MTNEDIIQRAWDRAEHDLRVSGLINPNDWETIRQCLTQAVELQAVAEEQNAVLLKARYFEEDNFVDGYGTATPEYREYWDSINKALSKYRELKGE